MVEKRSPRSRSPRIKKTSRNKGTNYNTQLNKVEFFSKKKQNDLMDLVINNSIDLGPSKSIASDKLCKMKIKRRNAGKTPVI